MNSLCLRSCRSFVAVTSLALFLTSGLLLAPFQACADLRLNIVKSGPNVVLSWTSAGAALECSLTVTGLWSEVSGAVSPYSVPPTNRSAFYRLRQSMTQPNFDYRYVAPTYTTSIGDPISGCGCTSPENPNGAGGNSQDNGMGSVFLHTGELTQYAVDLEIPGRGFDSRFARAYRSGMDYDGPLGHGWDFNYNRRLVVETNGNVLRMDGLGRADRYTLSGGVFQSPSGFYTRLTTNANGTFEERDRHGTTNFYSAANALGVARLTRIGDRNGNQMFYNYNAAGQLTNVMDTLNRSITYSYDSNGRLTSVMDFIGRTLQFGYNANGDLVSAQSPIVSGTPNGNDFLSGKTTRYSYTSNFLDARFNHNLQSVTAPNEVASGGLPRLVAQYDTNALSPNADRVLSLMIGGTNASGVASGDTISYAYASLGTVSNTDFISPVFQNTVINRNSNTNEYRFNQLGNIVRTHQFTRGLRPGEPVSFDTHMQYNKDGEMIARTNAELDSVEYAYQTNSTDRLQQGNLLAVRRLPGPRGGDQAQIITSTFYETNFNFAVTNIDGRGNVTRYAYDARGNRTNTIHRAPSIVEDFEYNAFGQMTNHMLPDNGSGHRRRDVMTYYSSGPQSGYLQSSIVDAGSTNFNLTNRFEYDAVGNVTRVTDPRGNDSTNVVNGLNQVVRSYSRAVSTTNGLVRYQTDTFYDANNNVIRVDVENRDDTGAVVLANPAFTTTYTYDILDNRLTMSQEVDPARNVVTAYTYDENQNCAITRFGEATAGNQTNNIVQKTYDERDLRFREIRAPGASEQSTMQFDYDRNGNLVRLSQGIEDLAAPHVTTFTYDGFDRRNGATDAMGNVTTMRYDSNGNTVTNRTDGELIDVPGSAANTNLSQTTYTYDAMDRRTLSEAAFFDTQTHTNIGDGLATTETIYSPNSQVLAVIDDNNHTNSTSYDTANRRNVVTDAKGNFSTYAYDSNGNAVTTTEVDKSDLGPPDQTLVTRFTYDNVDRLIQTVDNIGNTNRSAYDSRNNRKLTIDARGNGVRYAYDGLNRLLQTTRLLTDTGDGSGTVTGAITTKQTWDDSSRLTGQIDDNTNRTTYDYDPLNRPIFTVFADGTTNASAYDAHDNRVTMTDANTNIVTSVYDLLDHLTTNLVSRGPGILGTTFEQYQYDGLSRVVRAENDDSLVTRNHDSLSRITRETQQVVSSGAPTRTVVCARDALGNLLSCTYPGGRLVNCTYDALDRKQTISDSLGTIANYNFFGPLRVERRDYGNGTRAHYGYDGIRRMTNSLQSVIIGGTNIESRSYAWDASHNQTAINDLLAPAQDSRSFSYDSVNRLIQSTTAVVGPTNCYGLDGVGNRISVIGGTNAGTYFMNSAVPPADFQMNQYTTTPFDERTYDRNGNLTSSALRQFTYDYRNQLFQFINSGAVQTNTYKYDCFGRRIEKNNAGNVTRYYYTHWQEIEEQNSADAALATYVWGNGIDDLLQINRSGQKYFYHEDHLGSIRKITDSAGTVVEQNRYADYGTPSFFDAAGVSLSNSSVGNSYLFTGRRYDPESDLYYYRSRCLDSGAGRFTTRDSAGSWDDEENHGNAFAYVGNQPWSKRDEFGLGCNEEVQSTQDNFYYFYFNAGVNRLSCEQIQYHGWVWTTLELRCALETYQLGGKWKDYYNPNYQIRLDELYYSFKPRCRKWESNTESGTVFQVTFKKNYVYRNPYYRWRGLHKYYMRTRWSVRVNSSSAWFSSNPYELKSPNW